MNFNDVHSWEYDFESCKSVSSNSALAVRSGFDLCRFLQVVGLNTYLKICLISQQGAIE